MSHVHQNSTISAKQDCLLGIFQGILHKPEWLQSDTKRRMTIWNLSLLTCRRQKIESEVLLIRNQVSMASVALDNGLNANLLMSITFWATLFISRVIGQKPDWLS